MILIIVWTYRSFAVDDRTTPPYSLLTLTAVNKNWKIDHYVEIEGPFTFQSVVESSKSKAVNQDLLISPR